VKRAETREQATRYEVLAEVATDPTVREGYSVMAEQKRREVRGEV